MALAWKVCRRMNKSARLTSCFSDRVVGYELGKTTKRTGKNGPLACFSNREDARGFISLHRNNRSIAWKVCRRMNKSAHSDVRGGLLMFRVEVKLSEDRDLWTWNYASNCMYTRLFNDQLPRGTMLCDSVKLLYRAR